MYDAIPDFDLLASVPIERIRNSIYQNLPDSLRGEIWCMICQVKREKTMHAPGFYEKLVSLENPQEEHRIFKDVSRTFTNYPINGAEAENDASWNNEKGQEMLHNVLLAYTNYDA